MVKESESACDWKGCWFELQDKFGRSPKLLTEIVKDLTVSLTVDCNRGVMYFR